VQFRSMTSFDGKGFGTRGSVHTFRTVGWCRGREFRDDGGNDSVSKVRWATPYVRKSSLMRACAQGRVIKPFKRSWAHGRPALPVSTSRIRDDFIGSSTHIPLRRTFAPSAFSAPPPNPTWEVGSDVQPHEYGSMIARERRVVCLSLSFIDGKHGVTRTPGCSRNLIGTNQCCPSPVCAAVQGRPHSPCSTLGFASSEHLPSSDQ
jgi:hypothetical protein